MKAKEKPAGPVRARKWHPVTHDRPCPICGKADWCSLNSDASVVLCRRNPASSASEGWERKQTLPDRNGQHYGRWQQRPGAVVAAIPETGGETKKRASRKVRNKVYTILLDNLPLTTAAQRQLHQRGINGSEQSVRQFGYLDEERDLAVRAVIDAGLDKHLARVPGFYRADNGDWSIAGPQGIAVPVRDGHGQIIAVKIRADEPKKGPKYVYASSAKHDGPGPGSPVHVPLYNAGPVEEVRITEGELKADIATVKSGILTLGLPGVAAFALADPILTKLKPKQLIISFDADYRKNPVVAKALVAAIEVYRPLYRVIVETWEPEWGKGIDDVLAAGKKPSRLTDKAIDKLIRTLKRRSEASVTSTERPTIEITTEEKVVNNQAVAALGRDKTIFTRGNILVRVLTDSGKRKGIQRPHGSARIAALPKSVLREHLAHNALWVVTKGEGKVTPAHPPKWSVEAIYDRGHWPRVKPLEGIVFGPVFRVDGTILATEGYDENTGLICKPGITLPEVPDKPTRKDVRRALRLLREAVTDFPFQSETHEASWYTFLLTMLTRFAFEGPTPLYLADGNTPGAGKGLLCDLASVIATGRVMARTANSQSDDEMRKRITAIALAGDSHVLIDNINDPLGTPALDAALTSEVWKDRILGRSEIVELPLKAIWCATGNNVALRGDLPRRTMHSRLVTDSEHPEERTGFRHPELIRWAKETRGDLLAAALTLLRAYHVAGRPDQGLTPWGSYEGWSGVVRATAVWAGLPDAAETRQELTRTGDMKTQAQAALLKGLRALDPSGAGLMVAEIHQKITAPSDRLSEPAKLVQEALVQLCPTRNGTLAGPQSIGMVLCHLRDRNIGGHFLASRLRNNTNLWVVCDIDKGTTGTTGAISNPSRNESKGFSLRDVDMEGAQDSSPSARSPREHIDESVVI